MVVVEAEATPTIKQEFGQLGLIPTLIVSLVVTNYARITAWECAQRHRIILATRRRQPEPIPWAAVLKMQDGATNLMAQNASDRASQQGTQQK